LEQSPGERLSEDLANALRAEGRVECSLYLKDLWRCYVETDPGSGMGGGLTLRLRGNGCWKARHTRYAKGENWAYSRESLSLGDSEAVGRTFRGCTELED
jgi:hypothetical protein